MSRCCAKPTHAATARPSPTSGTVGLARPLMVRSASSRVSNHECVWPILRDAAKGPLLRMRQCGGTLPLADEADDVLDRVHGFRGDGAGAVGAVDQHGIDIALIGAQPLHFG